MRLGELQITVVEKGTLESSKNQDAFCNVEGGTSIIMIKPEGTRVTKGELVCELDSAALRDSLTNQQITTKSAESNFQNATLTREVAEISVTEYVEGIYKQDLATVEGEIKLAESELSRSADRVDWAQRMFLKGYVSLAQKVSEDLALKKARFALEQAQSKKKVLVDYTRDKTIKELQSDVEEGPVRRACEEGHVGSREQQGKEARTADQSVHDHGAERRACRVRERSDAGVHEQYAAG